MIGTGYTTQLQLLQTVPGLGVATEGETDPVWYLDVAMWYNPGPHFCECENMDDIGGCTRDGTLWGTSDPYEPKFCTRHYFGAAMAGYEWVELEAQNA